MTHRIAITLIAIACLYQHACSEEKRAAEGQARPLPEAIQKVWDNEAEQVVRNRKDYDGKNAKVLAELKQKIERIDPTAGVDDLAERFRREVITKHDAEAVPPVLPLPVDDIVIFNGHRYKLFLESMSWEKACDRCKDLGGHILSIETRDEQAFISAEITRFLRKNREVPDHAMAWLALTKTDKLRQWVGLDGLPQLYNNWEPMQPRAENDHAAIFLSSGRWFSLGPNRQLKLICEWDR